MITNMYKQPAVLDSNTHSDTTVSPTKSFAYASKVNFAPITVAEFKEACKDYPIFFKNTKDSVEPIAILGIKDNENLFLNKRNEWTGAKYIPAIIRIYPFALIEDSNGTKAIGIDEKYSGLNKKDGQKLFEDAKPTPYLENITKFISDLNTTLDMTVALMKKLKEFDLMSAVDMVITDKSGQKYAYPGLLKVDEEKLAKLSDEQLLELAKSGLLAFVNYHTISLTNTNTLVKLSK